MSRTLTAEEVLKKHQAAMPGPLGEIFHRLWAETATVHDSWDIFRLLFVESRETLETLNATAGGFFHDIAGVLGDSVILHICRLTDPPSTGSFDNLSLGKLPELISDAKLKANVSGLVAAAQRDSVFARDWRNKWIAHKDLVTKYGDLPPATVEAVKRSLAAIRDVIHAIEHEYLDGSKTQFDFSMDAAGGVHSLVFYLNQGLAAVEKERELTEE
jgi:hypothetical protein